MEGAPVISERQFATHYSSVWNAIAPLSEGFWSFENKQVDRIEVPLEATAPKGMRAIINESAFRAFCDLNSLGRPVGNEKSLAAIEENIPAAIAFVSRFSNAPSVKLSDIDSECRNEALALLRRLQRFFSPYVPITVRPKFKGCGVVSACEGDLIRGNCLYEVKAGDRPFRVFDLRQLLTYSALAYASECLSFEFIGLFNPRTGVAWSRSLEEVCHSISGLQPSDTLSALVEQFSAASASR